MSASDESSDRLLVAMVQDTAYVHVVGRGSFKVSTQLKQFGVAAMGSKCRRLVLDMTDCIGMDSTFMGVLAGLAFRLKQKSEGAVLLVNLSRRTLSLLTTLGLDQVVQPYLAGATPPEFEELLAQSRDGGETLSHAEKPLPPPSTEMILEAHEELARLTPDNLLKFKDVLTFLREDVRKQQGMDDGDAAVED